MPLLNSIGATNIPAVQGPPTPATTPTAQANAAISTTPVKATTPIKTDNNIASTQTANAAYAAANPNTFGSPTASTTTISNANKITQVPAIQSTTNNLSKTGISTDANGNATYANGTAYNPPLAAAPNPNPAPNPSTTTTGGYLGDVYYAPGATTPVDANGQPQALTPTSATDDQIMNNLTQAKAQSDAMTASLIDSIQSNYGRLIQQQTDANNSQQKNTNAALLHGGVTGSGSTSQYDPIDSKNIIAAQVSYGTQAIADLQSKEDNAILAAQQAGQNQDFQLQDRINQQISSIRDTKVAAATKLNDQIAAQNQALAQQKLQSNIDQSVGTLMAGGITDPTQILNILNNKGFTLSADQVATSIKALTPADQSQIQSLAAQAAAAGADPATVAKIANSSDFNSALTLATPALGAKTANDLAQQAFDNKIKTQQVQISQEQANTSYQHLLLDAQTANSATQAASQGAVNATVTTPSGKIYVDGSNLTPAEKAAALNAGQVLLDGTSAQAMTGITNIQGQVGALLTSLQQAGVVDQSGNFTGKGQSLGAFQVWPTGAAANSVANFGSNLKTMITDLNKLPGTGELTATLQNNVLSKGDSQDQVKTKISNITTALENSENTLLANGSIPQEGTTGTINGQEVTFTNGKWVTK